jgi:heat shock protein HslJ
MTWRGVMPLVLAVGLAACTSPATSSLPPAGSLPAASTSEGPTAEPAVFDFARTAWRVEAIDGQPLAVGAAPTLTFDPREGAKGSGGAFSGCTSFGFEWALDAGRAQIRPQGVDLGTCSGIAGQIEAAFLARLVPATEYSIAGDVFTLKGPAGQIRLRRDAPPIGDAGRAVLDLLRTGEWRVMAAPGIAAGTGPSGIRFGDTRVLATGECGFGGMFRMVQGAGVKFEELGWDTTTGCDAAHDAARTVLKRLLETATTARLGADGTSVVFSGPNGEVVLGR